MTSKMTRGITLTAMLAIATASCSRQAGPAAEPRGKAFGAAVVVVSGDKQAGGIGAQLAQPLVVQVNDAKGAAVAGALVRFTGPGGLVVTPAAGLTGSDGQLSVVVSLGSASGHYQVRANAPAADGHPVEIKIDEVALGYQEMQGAKLSELHCVRCHESESTAERVSNHDNLTAKAHSFTEGEVLNKLSNPDLVSIIGHGGAGLNRSAEMPPYGNTLTKQEIASLVAYVRAVADPPYVTQGVFNAGN